jgi:hypothetical protein
MNKRFTNGMRVVSILLMVLSLSLFVFFAKRNKESTVTTVNGNTRSTPLDTPDSEAQTPAKSTNIITPGVSVGEVQIGMSEEDVIRVWGEPKERPGKGTLAYWNKGVEVLCSPTKGVTIISCIDGIVTDHYSSFSGALSNGIKLGMTEKEIITIMGQPNVRKEMPKSRIVLEYPGIRFSLQAGWRQEWGNEPHLVQMVCHGVRQ